jgi:hypothetical protein
MSHVVKLTVKVTDLNAVRQAAADCGLEFHEGQTTYRWWGQSVGDYPLPAGVTAQDLGHCLHALSVPTSSPHCDQRRGSYEVGIVPARDGSGGYTLLMDFYNNGYGLCSHIGEQGEKLQQRIAYHETRLKALQQGFLIAGEHTLADGSIQLMLTR